MKESQELKIHNIFNRADENGVGEIARNLWDLKDYFTPWIYEDYWEFRLAPATDPKNYYPVLAVYPTAASQPHILCIAFNAGNLELLYNKSAESCREFIDRLHYMLGKPDIKAEPEWDCLYLSGSKQTYLFIKEFCYFAGY